MTTSLSEMEGAIVKVVSLEGAPLPVNLTTHIMKIVWAYIKLIM